MIKKEGSRRRIGRKVEEFTVTEIIYVKTMKPGFPV